MIDIDFNENEFFKEYPDVLEILLYDNTTKRNIVWGTSNYKRKGIGYSESDQILSGLITGKKSKVIKPRIEKSKAEQSKRSKDIAEVFTPSWICNRQNNLIDSNWFGYNGAFNEEAGEKWITTPHIDFKSKDWKMYVKDLRIEITCGEAPYIVSRYDSVTGNIIPLNDRIGILDRKLRVVNENASNNDEWVTYSIIALKSVYGYEFQGDNLLIARENILSSWIEYYINRFNNRPNRELIVEIAKIISWNFWQMDGISLVAPYTCHDEEVVQLSLFEEVKPQFCKGCRNGNPKDHNGKRCIIMDWEKNKKIKFIDLIWR